MGTNSGWNNCTGFSRSQIRVHRNHIYYKIKPTLGLQWEFLETRVRDLREKLSTIDDMILDLKNNYWKNCTSKKIVAWKYMLKVFFYSTLRSPFTVLKCQAKLYQMTAMTLCRSGLVVSFVFDTEFFFSDLKKRKELCTSTRKFLKREVLTSWLLEHHRQEVRKLWWLTYL
jgi:hypothetical protein